VELRQLTTEHERQVFAKCLAEARATRGIGFKDTARSQLGRAHLSLGGLYALFEHNGEAAEKMVAGFRMHDLATLPQSHPRPDMSHLPPEFVLESGELWSLSRGAGRVASHAAGAIAGVLRARAVLIHPILRPVDLTDFYRELNFTNASEPVEWPFAKTIEGGKIWVQPMLLEGEGLEEWIRLGWELVLRASEGTRALRFEAPASVQPWSRGLTDRSKEGTATGVPPSAEPEQVNGTTAS
jgi:hypothetical protein